MAEKLEDGWLENDLHELVSSWIAHKDVIPECWKGGVNPMYVDMNTHRSWLLISAIAQKCNGILRSSELWDNGMLRLRLPSSKKQVTTEVAFGYPEQHLIRYPSRVRSSTGELRGRQQHVQPHISPR